MDVADAAVDAVDSAVVTVVAVAADAVAVSVEGEVDAAALAVTVVAVVVVSIDVLVKTNNPARGAPRGGRGGRGGAGGGRGGLGKKGPGAVTIEAHKHDGVYIAKGKEHLLVTRNLTPGESVYGEKRISVAGSNAEGEEEKVEYRVWNPFRSKLAAGILGGLDDIHVSRQGLAHEHLPWCQWMQAGCRCQIPASVGILNLSGT